MKREQIAPRPDWIERSEEVGFTYHTLGQAPGEIDGVYWDESVCYRFEMEEVLAIETATADLHQLCLKAVDHIVGHPELMDDFEVPAAYKPWVAASWRRSDPSVMGRFDLAFEPGSLAVKLLEYNADTPTLVIETAVVQWFWLQAKYPDRDQFNSLHERLIERYRHLAGLIPASSRLHFTSLPGAPVAANPEAAWSLEEFEHARYFLKLAAEAGIQAAFCSIHDVGWNGQHLVDRENNLIRYWSKLYPWEWLAQEAFGSFLADDQIGCVEPVWKMLLSNKAILPVLWRLFPNHSHLLAAYPSFPNQLTETGRYIAKPRLAREGANIVLSRRKGERFTTAGTYGASRPIYQELADLPSFDGHSVVIGSWIVGDEPAGMILREATGPIVVSTSRVVPHYIDAPAPKPHR